MKKTLILALALTLMPGLSFANDNPFDDNSQAVKFIGKVAQSEKNAEAGIALNVAAPVYQPVAVGMNLEQVFNRLNKGDTNVMAKVRYIPFNDDALYVRWKIIEDAKKTIDCTYYIIDKDIFGQAYLGMLARKAKQGVKIRLMIDGRIYRSGYMKGMPDMFQELSSFPNVQIKIYNSVLKSLAHVFTDFQGLYASNHDKILIGDGKTCIIGGRNIGPDYFAGNGEYPCVYRDTDVAMEGEHVSACLKKAFDEEWVSLRNSVVKPDMINWKDQKDRMSIADQVLGKYMRGLGIVAPEKTKLSKANKKILAELNTEVINYKDICSFKDYEIFTNEPLRKIKIIDKTSSFGKFNDITSCIVSLIDSAKKEIVIQNPYVVITDKAYAALKRASLRKVKIIFHTNSGASTDSLFPQAFLMNDWVKMLTDMPTCRILVAPSVNERIHSKTFVFDSKVTIIGSYNMDPLSESANSEVVAAVYDDQFGVETREQIEKDMEKVLEYKIAVGRDGKVTVVYGPESHLDPKMIKKMNFYRKLKWIRPVI